MSKPPKAPQSGPRGGLSMVTSKWLETSDPARRKSLGQYMTPHPVAEALIDRVPLAPGARVLDPGVGTGELLRVVLDREPTVETTGWDVDAAALKAASELVPEAKLEQRSALEAGSDPAGNSTETGGAISSGRFDLVVGNPPYFQLRLDPAERERFSGVISGRPNIFALFFQAGLQQLRPGGTLAYIVPPSMNSGAYFESLREYLVNRTEIEDLTILEGTDLFEGANTAIQLLVLKKQESSPQAKEPVGRKTRSPGQNPTHHSGRQPVGRITRSPGHDPTHRGFVFEREVPEAGFRRVLFTPDPARLAAEFEGRHTLWELGLEAVTGQVIWNENRDRLTGQPGPGRVPLIWSHNIGEGELRPPKPSGQGEKPGFYHTAEGGKTPLTGPAIVVNRVTGAVGRGELRAALIPEGMEFLAENHVNVIRLQQAKKPGGSENTQGWSKPDPPGEAEISGSDYTQGWSQSDPPGVGAVDWVSVLASLRGSGVVERVRLLTGNTQISARELTHLLPLD